LYVGIDEPNGGIFKSTDGGSNWAPVNSLGSVPTQTLFVSKASLLGVYASTDNGVFYSGNGGASWVPIGATLPFRVTSFAASSTALYAGTASGVFQSTDGQTWSPLGASTLSMTVWSIALGSPSGSTIFAGTDTAGVFRSVDGGADWAASNFGLTGA